VRNIAYNVDCMVAMKDMADKEFDLAIVDPPYRIGVDTAMRKSAGTQYGNAAAPKATYHTSDWDTEPPAAEYFNELRRVSKNQILWGANHYISKMPIDSSCWIVWDKKNGTNNFADCELAYTSFNTAVRKFDFMWNGMLQGDMKNKEFRIHPTQKPVALYKWLLTNYAKEGDLILDTHLGSGSSRIACYDMGFDFTGFEIDKNYFDAQEERFRVHTSQIRMEDLML